MQPYINFMTAAIMCSHSKRTV